MNFTMIKILTLTNVLTLTVHYKSLRVRSYKGTKFFCPYWKTLQQPRQCAQLEEGRQPRQCASPFENLKNVSTPVAAE